MQSRRGFFFGRLKVGLRVGLTAMLVGLPVTAQAETIMDLESLVVYLNDNRDQTINLRTLTSLNQISSNPDKPDEPKSVGSTFIGNLNGGGVMVVLGGSPLFNQLSGAKIENLQLSGEINAPSSSNVGALASVVDSSEIINVTAQNVAIQAGDESGILVGKSQDSIYKDVTVVNSEISGSTRIGGVVGDSLADSFETVLVKNTSVEGTGDNIGGISGKTLSSEMSFSQVESTTVIGSGSSTGGAVGYLDSSTVTNVITKSVVVDGERYVGGIAGFANRNTSASTISNAIVQGTIEGNDDVGGITGYSNLTLRNTIMIGEVIGQDKVGGLVGTQAGNDVQIEGSSFTGNVSGDGSVGGLVGEASSIIRSSISIAEVRGTSSVGGLAGKWFGPDTSTVNIHVYSYGQVLGNSNVGGLAGEVQPTERWTCTSWTYPSPGVLVCVVFQRTAYYPNFEDARASETVSGLSQVGSIFGATVNSSDISGVVLTNPDEQYLIKYPNDNATVVSIGGNPLSESSPTFRIGENGSRYRYESYSDPSISVANGEKLASAIAKTQSSLFINSESSSGGVEVFTSWAGLVASETGVWGQCTPGSLPYLRAIVKVNPCPNQSSSQSSGSQGSGSASLRANVFAPQSRDASSRVTESLAKMITSGGKIDVLSLRDSGFENLTLKVQSELNSLIGGSDADLVKKQLESILVNASFFDLGFQPSSKTFEFFGIRGVSEKLIPKILDLVRNSPDSSIGVLERIENVTNRVLILDLISSSDQRPRLSSELVIKAGLVDSKSPHIKLVARMIARLSPTQVDTVEELVKAATEIKVKAETRMSKLQQRKLAFAA